MDIANFAYSHLVGSVVANSMERSFKGYDSCNTRDLLTNP